MVCGATHSDEVTAVNAQGCTLEGVWGGPKTPPAAEGCGRRPFRGIGIYAGASVRAPWLATYGHASLLATPTEGRHSETFRSNLIVVLIINKIY